MHFDLCEHIYTYMHTYIYTCIRTYIHAHIYTHICIHTGDGHKLPYTQRNSTYKEERLKSGLPQDGVVLCNFNHLHKTSRNMWLQWARILNYTKVLYMYVCVYVCIYVCIELRYAFVCLNIPR